GETLRREVVRDMRAHGPGGDEIGRRRGNAEAPHLSGTADERRQAGGLRRAIVLAPLRNGAAEDGARILGAGVELAEEADVGEGKILRADIGAFPPAPEFEQSV